MQVVDEWMDNDDALETRMFYELMQAYRFARLEPETIQAFELVKGFVRDHARRAIVSKWITDVWGERCPDYSPNCITCDLWAAFDDEAKWQADQATGVQNG